MFHASFRLSIGTLLWVALLVGCFLCGTAHLGAAPPAPVPCDVCDCQDVSLWRAGGKWYGAFQVGSLTMQTTEGVVIIFAVPPCKNTPLVSNGNYDKREVIGVSDACIAARMHQVAQGALDPQAFGVLENTGNSNLTRHDCTP